MRLGVALNPNRPRRNKSSYTCLSQMTLEFIAAQMAYNEQMPDRIHICWHKWQHQFWQSLQLVQIVMGDGPIFQARNARCRASRREPTPMQCFAPQYAAYSCSKDSSSLPSRYQPESMTRCHAASNSSLSSR